ncbi:MAG: hypothetical protein ACRDWD_16165 [Acidimicrobiia bacterium]
MSRLAPLLVLSGAFYAAACGSGGGGDDGAHAPGSYERMYEALCNVETESRSGDLQAGRAEFFDNAHQDLHELAAEAAHSDRAAAARLLDAKQAVEGGLDTMSSGLPRDVADLIAAAGNAILAVGDPEPTPCTARGVEQ